MSCPIAFATDEKCTLSLRIATVLTAHTRAWGPGATPKGRSTGQFGRHACEGAVTEATATAFWTPWIGHKLNDFNALKNCVRSPGQLGGLS